MRGGSGDASAVRPVINQWYFTDVGRPVCYIGEEAAGGGTPWRTWGGFSIWLTEEAPAWTAAHPATDEQLEEYRLHHKQFVIEMRRVRNGQAPEQVIFDPVVAHEVALSELDDQREERG